MLRPLATASLFCRSSFPSSRPTPQLSTLSRLSSSHHGQSSPNRHRTTDLGRLIAVSATKRFISGLPTTRSEWSDPLCASLSHHPYTARCYVECLSYAASTCVADLRPRKSRIAPAISDSGFQARNGQRHKIAPRRSDEAVDDIGQVFNRVVEPFATISSTQVVRSPQNTEGPGCSKSLGSRLYPQWQL